MNTSTSSSGPNRSEGRSEDIDVEHLDDNQTSLEPTRANLLHEEQGLEDERLDNQGELVEEELEGLGGSGIPAVDDVRSDNQDDERNERR